MFRRSLREPDVEANPGGIARQDDLDFHDPSWIIVHHRHSLIEKIKPENSWVDFLRDLGRRRSAGSTEAHNEDHDGQEPGHHYNQESAARNGPLGSNSQQPAGTPDRGGLEGSEQSYRVNLSELQRLRLRQLQHKLVQHVVHLRYDATEPSGWADDLRQYVQALQDHDYMRQFIYQRRDPFYVTGQRFIDRRMLEVAMERMENEKDPLRLAKTTGKWETADTHPEPIGGTRNQSLWQAWVRGFRQRVVVAAVGGIFLIAPMWLMVLHKTLYTALVSTTVCVAIFGLVMALFLDKTIDVMSSTAAYAAVLVVFVGLTTKTP